MPWWSSGADPNVQPTVKTVGKSIPMQLEEWIAAQPDGPPAKAWRVSGLGYICPRKMALEQVFSAHLKPVKFADPRFTLRLDVGTSVHWWWQNCYLGPMGKLIGTWQCMGCQTKVEGKQPSKRCECGGRPRGPGWVYWEYVEPTVKYQEPHWSMPIVGHPDGVVEDTPPEGETDPFGLLELKTWNPKAMPVFDIWESYRIQAQVYMWLLGKKWCKFVFIDPVGIFENKDDPTTLPCQEIVIRYDDSYRVKALALVEAAEKALRESAAIAAGQETFKAWPEKVCETKRCKMAERCGVRDTCFDAVLMERVGLRIQEGRDPVTGLR